MLSSAALQTVGFMSQIFGVQPHSLHTYLDVLIQDRRPQLHVLVQRPHHSVLLAFMLDAK